MTDLPINLVFEDALSGAVLARLLRETGRPYLVGRRQRSGGVGWIKNRINGINHAAKGMPWLVLADLDRQECPPGVVQSWLKTPRHPNMIFRIAVREVEAWLLAGRAEFAEFIGGREEWIPRDVEGIDNAKEFLIDLVKRSPRKDLRDDIVPRSSGLSRTGPDYNGRLIRYVRGLWNPTEAQEYSPSLRGTMRALREFQPCRDDRAGGPGEPKESSV